MESSGETWEQVHKRDMRIATAQAQFMMNLGNYARKKTGTTSRVLSIDGGGSRAIVAIEILRALEAAASESGQKLQIRDMFDVIVGSGSGAFLAVALAHGLTLDQCEKLINDFATEVFGGNVLVQFIPRLFRYIKSKGWYDDAALQTLLEGSVRGKESFKPSQEEKRKLTVTIVSAEDSVRLFSTNVQAGADSHLIDVSTVTTGQVLMASNALRSYFSPVIIDVGGRLRTFADGALVANNPVFNAFSEAHRIRPGPKFIVSVGTGEAKEAKKYSLSAPTCNKPVDIPGYDEHTHQKFAAFVKGQGEGASSIKYERFNPPGSDLPMDTSDLELLKRIRAETKEYLRRSDTRTRIQNVIDALSNTEKPFIPPTMNMNQLLGKQG